MRLGYATPGVGDREPIGVGTSPVAVITGYCSVRNCEVDQGVVGIWVGGNELLETLAEMDRPLRVKLVVLNSHLSFVSSASEYFRRAIVG